VSDGTPFGRVRVRRDQAEQLLGILYRERSRLIGLKIETRASGFDTEVIRQDLIRIKFMMEEVQRALKDINDG
jgi:hypothetical protein